MSEEEKDVAGGANHPTRHGSTDKFSVNVCKKRRLTRSASDPVRNISLRGLFFYLNFTFSSLPKIIVSGWKALLNFIVFFFTVILPSLKSLTSNSIPCIVF